MLYWYKKGQTSEQMEWNGGSKLPLVCIYGQLIFNKVITLYSGEKDGLFQQMVVDNLISINSVQVQSAQ